MDEVTDEDGISVARRLEAHPALKARIMRILDVAENSAGDVTRADDAEQRAIDELRALGQELLHDWGQRREDVEFAKAKQQGGVVQQVKKTPLAQHVR
jgi:hypothetical protein